MEFIFEIFGIITIILIALFLRKKILNRRNLFSFNKSDLIWFIWIMLIIIWNYVWPNVKPIADVIVAIFLSIFMLYFKK